MKRLLKFSVNPGTVLTCLLAAVLSSCSLVQYSPVPTIDHIDPDHGYRSRNHVTDAHNDENMIFLLFSAAFRLPGCRCLSAEKIVVRVSVTSFAM